MLIAHYPLNGDARDYFGNDGTSTNVTWVDGKIGQAGSFNGTSSSIDTGYKISDFIGDISICGWIKCNDLSERNPLVGADTSGVKPQVSIDGVENSVNAMFNNDTNQYYVSSSAYSYVLSKPANSYTHVCATYRDEVPKLYVDGNEYTLTLGGTGGDPTTSTPITIGKGFRNGVTRYANAVIDDVRIYDHALSEKEVSNISKPTNALWKMTHASLSDSTANLPDLIPVNSPALGGDALFGEVWDFDTTLDQGFGTGSNFPNITNDAAFSLSAWINLRSVSVDDIVPEAFAIVGHAGRTGFGMQVLVDKINFGARATSNFSGNISIVLGEWTHVACTREVGGLCRIYINGVLDVTSNNNLDVGSPSEEVEVGSATTRLSSFDGQIAYVGIYSDTLTSEQIKEDYKTGLSIDNIGNMHSKHLDESPKVRYIRETLNGGNTSNDDNHWLEIKAFNTEGVNVALDANAYDSDGAQQPLLTDGITSGSYINLYEGEDYVEVDLGGETFLDTIQVWHYYLGASRYYHDVKLEVSVDGVNWVMIFDSIVDGTYTETSSGKVHQVLPASKFSVNYSGVSVGEASEVGISRGLVSWLPLIGDTKDRVTNEVATNNGAISVADGYEFDGVNDYIDLGSNKTFSTTAWTISGSFTPDVVTGTNNLIGINGYASNTNWTSVRDSRLALWIHSSNDPNRGWWYADTTLVVGVKYTFSLTYDGEGNYIFYLNGVVDSSGWPTFLKELDNGIIRYIGSYDAGSTRLFNGVIGNIKAHDVALTPEEIAQEYNSGKASLNKSSAFAKEFIEV